MNKKFDSVEFQRRVREELSEEFNSNPDLFLGTLKQTYRDWKKKNKAAGKRRSS